MSTITVSPIEETDVVHELEPDSHEPDEAAGPVEPAPKPKRVRK